MLKNTKCHIDFHTEFIKDRVRTAVKPLKKAPVFLLYLLILTVPAVLNAANDHLVITKVYISGGTRWIEIFNPTSGSLTLDEVSFIEENNEKICSNDIDIVIPSGTYWLATDDASNAGRNALAANSQWNTWTTDAGGYSGSAIPDDSEGGIKIKTKENNIYDAVGWDASGTEADIGNPNYYEGSDIFNHSGDVEMIRKTNSDGIPIDTDVTTNDWIDIGSEPSAKTGYNPGAGSVTIGKPGILSPSADTNAKDITFSWTAVEGADWYYLLITNITKGGGSYYSGVTNVTSLYVDMSANISNGNVIQWNIAARSNDGSTWGETNVSSFTYDLTPPATNRLSPPHDPDLTNAVSAQATLSIMFSESITLNRGSLFIKTNGTNGPVAWTTRATNHGETLTISNGTNLIITPPSPLPPKTTSCLYFDTGFLKDTAGNEVAGLPEGEWIFVTASPDSIVLNEVCADPVNGTEAEWFEVVNTSLSKTNDLTGYHYYDGSSSSDVSFGTLKNGDGAIPPGGYALVVGNWSGFTNAYTNFANHHSHVDVYQPSSMSLLNSGETLKIKDALGLYTESGFDYGERADASYERENPEAALPGHWSENSSILLGDVGTPGFKNASTSWKTPKISVFIDGILQSHSNIYNIGTVVTNASNVTKTLTISNGGSADLFISNYNFTPDGDSHIAKSGSVASPLAPGDTSEFTVTFTPPDLIGSFTNTLHITNSDSLENPFELTFYGKTVAQIKPELLVYIDGHLYTNGASYNTGAFYTNTSNLVILTLSNVGSAAADFSHMTFSETAGFFFTEIAGNPAEDFSGLSLTPGGYETCKVVFTPLSNITYNAWLTISNIHTNTDLFHTPYNLTLTGVGKGVYQYENFNILSEAVKSGWITNGVVGDTNIYRGQAGASVFFNLAAHTLKTPLIDLPDELTIYYYPTSAGTELEIFISVDNGGSWEELKEFTGNEDMWNQARVSIGSYNRGDGVRLRFEKGDSGDLYVDDALFSKGSTAERFSFSPLAGTALTVTQGSANITLAAFKLSSTSNDAVLTDLSVSNGGTMTDSDINSVKLFYDTDQSQTKTSEDIFITNLIHQNAGLYIQNDMNLSLGQAYQGTNFVISLNINSNAKDERTFIPYFPAESLSLSNKKTGTNVVLPESHIVFSCEVTVDADAAKVIPPVVINEVAWMGTADSSGDEWIELYNQSGRTIDLTGWQIEEAGSGDNAVTLSGIVSNHCYFLIEKNEDVVTNIFSDMTASLSLLNDGESLVLKDDAGKIIERLDYLDGWPAGETGDLYISMERINPLRPGSDEVNWANYNTNAEGLSAYDKSGNAIYGTPGRINSVFDRPPELRIFSYNVSNRDLYTGTSNAAVYAFSGFDSEGSNYSVTLTNTAKDDLTAPGAPCVITRLKLYKDQDTNYAVTPGVDLFITNFNMTTRGVFATGNILQSGTYYVAAADIVSAAEMTNFEETVSGYPYGRRINMSLSAFTAGQGTNLSDEAAQLPFDLMIKPRLPEIKTFLISRTNISNMSGQTFDMNARISDSGDGITNVSALLIAGGNVYTNYPLYPLSVSEDSGSNPSKIYHYTASNLTIGRTVDAGTNFRFCLKAYEGRGYTNSSVTIPAIVSGNRFPQISNMSLSPTNVLDTGTFEVILTVSASDPDGTITNTTADLRRLGGYRAEALTNTESNIYTLRYNIPKDLLKDNMSTNALLTNTLTVYDNQGSSSSCIFTVKVCHHRPPSLNPGTNLMILRKRQRTLSPKIITFNGADITNLTWEFPAGSNEAGLRLDHYKKPNALLISGSHDGSSALKLCVTDEYGYKASGMIFITVTNDIFTRQLSKETHVVNSVVTKNDGMIAFKNITPSSEIRIYNSTGMFIEKITAQSGVWELPQDIAPGVYNIIISDGTEETRHLKMIITP